MTLKNAYKIIQDLGKPIDSKASTVAGLALAIKYASDMPKEVLEARELVQDDMINYMLSA